MKVLVINWRDIKNPEAGGADIHIDEILKRKPSDWEVDFVSASFPKAPKEEDLNAYHIIRLPNNFIFNFSFKYYWNRIFRKKNYDLIIDDISKIPLATPLYIKDIPILAIHHHVHGKSLFDQLFFPLALYVYEMERHFLKAYQNTPLISVSESSAKELRSIADFRYLQVSYSGADLSLIRDLKEIKTPYPSMVYLGRLKKYKRVDEIIRAFSMIRSEFPDLKLFIGGKGDDELRLKKLASDLPGVEFKGFISEEEKGKLLARSWIHVIASEKEGWGLSVIEAGAAKTPTVAYDVEGLRDSVLNGKTGILVPNGDTKAFADALRKLFLQKDLREKMGEEAKLRALNFDWDKTAEDFYRIVFQSIEDFHKKNRENR